MHQWKQGIIRGKLAQIFEASDVDTVLTWLISNEGRRPVVVVGAGFSRNAQNRVEKRPVTSEEIPLWGALLERFRQDLSLPPTTSYDALTLAELYHDEMEPAAFYSALLEMVKNDDLEPGDAHLALFNYPVEAIVTTNMLDTLLDKNGREWLRTVQDPDLAIRKCGACNAELIYFHGHRDNRTSWVLTRSQYEDLTKSRPLIVTRVRQLLSQHPVLLVGYGLGDPDFHHIYRQISLDMSYGHPLGLALFPRGTGPRPSEVRHWGKLGIRVARFGETFSTSESFVKFFEISPVYQRSSSGVSLVRDEILRERELQKRVRFAQEFLDDESTVELHRMDVHSRFRIWLTVLEAEFSTEEWERVNTVHLDDERYANSEGSIDVTSKRDPASFFTGFKVLPTSRFGATDHLTRQIDAFLYRRVNSNVELARWMTYAWQSKLVNNDQPLFLDALSWLSRTVAEDPTTGKLGREEAIATIRECLIFAEKYNYPRAHIIEDALAVGIDATAITPASDLSPNFVQAMQAGFEKTLNGAFEEAQDSYKRAGDMARDVRDTFGRWVALRGEFYAWAATSDFQGQLAKEWKSAKDVYWRQIVSLEQHADVRRWLEDAQTKRDRVKDMLLTQFITQRRRQLVGGRSMSFNNFTHEYWATFRDLETISASPGQQQEYVQPLIDISAFDVGEELGYRLRLGVNESEKTTEWVARILDDHICSLQDATTRNEALLREFTRKNSTKFERFHRLKVFPEIAEVLRTDDLDWTRQFLLECKAQFSREVRTHSHHHALHDEHAKAWGAYANIEFRTDIVGHLDEYASTISDEWEGEEYAKSLRRLPLAQWVGMFECPERLVRLVFAAARNPTQDNASRTDEHIGWALHSVVRGSVKFGREIPSDLRIELRAFSERVLRKNLSENRGDMPDAFNAAVHLAWSVADDDTSRSSVTAEALARIDEQSRLTGELGPGLGGPLGLWHSLVEAGADPQLEPMADAGTHLWHLLDEKWVHVTRFVENNPHHAWPYVAFLVDVLKSNRGDRACIAQERLLTLVRMAPIELRICDDVLHEKYWGNHWRSLVDQVWQSASGAGTNAVEARLGAVKLFQGWLAGTSNQDELNGDLSFLTEIILLSISDERPSVANHAAYDVTRYAHHVFDRAHVDRVVTALRRISRDPRIHVRGAAAYAGAMFKRLDVASEIRAVAEELDAYHSQEPYAVIQRQRRFGALDGQFPDPEISKRQQRDS